MRMVYILACFLALSFFMVVIDNAWSLPFDVKPPKCYLCCDVNFDGQVDVYDVIIVARSYGSTRDMPRWNPAADVNRDGVVDIHDVALVIRCWFLLQKCLEY
ncbi:MAG: dockerin type I domain-containing protein [Candidatus Bathycorpusculaceae bacterium]